MVRARAEAAGSRGFPAACILGAALALGTAGCAGSPGAGTSLEDILSSCRTAAGMPAVAGALFAGGQIRIHAEGLRRAGKPDPVSPEDRFHIGSNLKAMTATMIAVLVEEGLLSWGSTIGEVFPDFYGSVPNEFLSVTLTQLLTHHGGVAPFVELADMEEVPGFPGTTAEGRRAFSEWVLKDGHSDPGLIGTAVYSNAGYVIAASMAEEVAGKTWEELMDDRLFEPLGIVAVFAWPGEGGLAQPWGHVWDGIWQPFDPDGPIQFPELFYPAGNLSLNLRDYMKFLGLHLAGLSGSPAILDEAAFAVLHQAYDGFSMGWIEGTNPDSGDPVSFHEGSDGTFAAFVVLRPAEGRAAAVFCNCEDTDEVSGQIILACVAMIDEVR